jgi:lipopolysaccharide biosynthesis glycosyltransferase
MELIDIVVGFDQREAIAYHVFCQTVLEKSSIPVRFTPLAINTLHAYREEHTDGSNKFIYTRFLTPYICGFRGWCIFADGDMVCQDDIAKLWSLRDSSKAVMVVKHDYKTKKLQKYLGNKNEDYPRKNWSSLILWNCDHSSHKVLTPDFVKNATGSYLHRFSWLKDEDIGELPTEWNWLAVEYPNKNDAKIIHYTLGTPCFRDYRDTELSDQWHSASVRAMEGFDK